MVDKIYVYSDGGCRFSKGIGGWAYILKYKNHVKEVCGNAEGTTNNLMELYAAIFALEAIKDKSIPIVLTCDSNYVLLGISEWSKNWKEKNWRGSKGKTIENKEVWQRLIRISDQLNIVEFIHVDGHSGHKENERCDEMCNIAMNELEQQKKALEVCAKLSCPEYFGPNQ
jgi:ribonuclease HI